MFDEDVISFAHGDGLRPPASAVVVAGIDALLDGATFPLERYNFLERHEPLEESIHSTLRDEGFSGESATHVCIDAGTSKLFVSYLMATAEVGDVVLTAPTFYHGLVGWCDLLRLELEVVSTLPTDGFKLSYETLESAHFRAVKRCGRPPRVLVVFNPTQCGAIYTAAELDEVAAYCDRFSVAVVEDNIFARTRFDLSRPIPHLAADRRLHDRVVSLDGCSKADGLANVRVGWAVGPQPLIDRMEAIKAATTVGMPYVALVMADAALRVGFDSRERDVAECARRSIALSVAIDELNDWLGFDQREGLRVAHVPEAGHSMLVDANGLRSVGGPFAGLENSVELAAFWLDRAAVAVSPLYSSALDGLECRLNFGSLQRRPATHLRTFEDPDVRALILASVKEGDVATAGRLVESCRSIGTEDADTVYIAQLIREGIIERVGSALQPRALAAV
jgi:aspartate aminotransferase